MLDARSRKFTSQVGIEDGEEHQDEEDRVKEAEIRDWMDRAKRVIFALDRVLFWFLASSLLATRPLLQS